jgi:hypothetical protein
MRRQKNSLPSSNPSEALSHSGKKDESEIKTATSPEQRDDKKPKVTESEPTPEKKDKHEPWSNAITSGLASAVIAGLSAGFGNGQLGFGAWIVCYFLFINWLKPESRKILAVTIMVVLGFLIGVIIQHMR